MLRPWPLNYKHIIYFKKAPFRPKKKGKTICEWKPRATGIVAMPTFPLTPLCSAFVLGLFKHGEVNDFAADLVLSCNHLAVTIDAILAFSTT